MQGQKTFSLNFYIPIKPLSDNLHKKPAIVKGKARLVKTRDAREYAEKIEFFCLQNMKPLNEFREAFKKDMVIQAHYSFDVPEDVFWTNKGQVSLYSQDTTNLIKILQDNLTSMIGVDDKFITDGTFKKRPSHDWGIFVTYEIYPKSAILSEVESVRH